LKAPFIWTLPDTNGGFSLAQPGVIYFDGFGDMPFVQRFDLLWRFMGSVSRSVFGRVSIGCVKII
jgi:hypothetical protein